MLKLVVFLCAVYCTVLHRKRVDFEHGVICGFVYSKLKNHDVSVDAREVR